MSDWTFTASTDDLRRIERRAMERARNLAHEPIETVLAAEQVASAARAELRRRVSVPAIMGGHRDG